MTNKSTGVFLKMITYTFVILIKSTSELITNISFCVHAGREDVWGCRPPAAVRAKPVARRPGVGPSAAETAAGSRGAAKEWGGERPADPRCPWTAARLRLWVGWGAGRLRGRSPTTDAPPWAEEERRGGGRWGEREGGAAVRNGVRFRSGGRQSGRTAQGGACQSERTLSCRHHSLMSFWFYYPT